MDLGIQIGGTLLVYTYPLILLAIFASPLIVTYFWKKNITLLSGVISAMIGVLLVALTLYGSYWGIVYLQGEAFKSLYGL